MRPHDPSMTQKVLVVTVGPTGAATASLDALGEHLRAGWRVAHATPMGGGGQTDGFASLVVLERAAETEAEAIVDALEEEMEGDGAPDEAQAPLLRHLRGDE